MKSARCFFGVLLDKTQCDEAQSDSGSHSQRNPGQQIDVNLVHDLYVGQHMYRLVYVMCVFRQFASQYIAQVDFSPRLVGVG
jgi:hypothetical protein